MNHSIRNIAKLACMTSAVVLLGACSHMGKDSGMGMGKGMGKGMGGGMEEAMAGGMPAKMGSASPMTFFVTSANAGKGGDFGGLAGADAYCGKLAADAGAGGKNWKAYLSTTGAGSVNARDRIGKGPWQNAKGVVIATSVDDLHSANNKLNKATALTEKGEGISGRGDAVNLHDILTGSGEDGRVDAAAAAKGDTTCGNWTLSGAGSAIVGHHDRVGLNESAPMKSWNASHATRGCDMPSLKATGGGGLMYCFAAN